MSNTTKDCTHPIEARNTEIVESWDGEWENEIEQCTACGEYLEKI